MEDSVKILAMKQFIIPFSSGVIVITDWKRNNYLDKNRLKETIYQNEKNQLTFNQITEKYELLLNPLKSSVKQSLNKCLTSIEEKRVEENRIEENSVDGEERQEYQTPTSTPTSEFLNRQDYQTPNSQDIDIELFDYLETNFGRTVSPIEILKIQSYKDSLPLEVIKEGINRACINNAKNVAYVMGILNSWKSKGFKTIEQCRQEFNNNKSKNKQQNYIAPEPDWLNQKPRREEVKLTDEERRELEDIERKLGIT